MTEHRNNKGRIIFSVVLIVFCSMLLALCFILPNKAHSALYYTSSAHGSSSDGVNRTATEDFGYWKGNCAHCHEQHASIGGSEPAPDSLAGPDNYLLFMDLWVDPIQSKLFCYGCHIESNSYQSGGYINNYSYSYRAGGDDTPPLCPDSVYESFQFVDDDCVRQSNCGSSKGSSHMLKDIRDYITGSIIWNFPGTNTYVNPCSGCHNPHRAQREWAVSRPSQHSTNNSAWGLWGDEDGEKMSDYTAGYQPPNKHVGGGTERDADTQPDYVTFCLDCHGAIQNKCSTTVAAVNWNTSQHGKGVAAGEGTVCAPGCSLKPPYNDALRGTYVLCCTDCHEPHGSSNEWLLRTTVNGVSGLQIAESEQWFNWCSACHDLTNHVMATPAAHCGTNTGCHVKDGDHSTDF
jgi:hypothetical protein